VERLKYQAKDKNFIAFHLAYNHISRIRAERALLLMIQKFPLYKGERNYRKNSSYRYSIFYYCFQVSKDWGLESAAAETEKVLFKSEK
jgi:hypothetical protein